MQELGEFLTPQNTIFSFFFSFFFFGETLTKLMFYEILRRPLYINLASNSSLISTLLHVVFFLIFSVFDLC